MGRVLSGEISQSRLDEHRTRGGCGKRRAFEDRRSYGTPNTVNACGTPGRDEAAMEDWCNCVCAYQSEGGFGGGHREVAVHPYMSVIIQSLKNGLAVLSPGLQIAVEFTECHVGLPFLR